MGGKNIKKVGEQGLFSQCKNVTQGIVLSQNLLEHRIFLLFFYLFNNNNNNISI